VTLAKGNPRLATANSTCQNSTAKPAKPRNNFSHYAHASGKWAKKINGKLHCFGRWDDPAAAQQEYLEQASKLHAGRKPKPKATDG